MEAIVVFVQAHRPYLEVLQAVATVINLVVWLFALGLLMFALRHRRIESLAVGPFNFRIMKEEAMVAAATASAAWQSPAAAENQVDVPRIRATIDRMFTPGVLNNLMGKAVLWVDDRPEGNRLAMRALKKFGLDIEQVPSTEEAMAALARRKFDLVISDMARGSDQHAGWGFLKLLRDGGSGVPFFIFSSLDLPEYRREAEKRGAQLSTNDMIELIDHVGSYLGRAP